MDPDFKQIHHPRLGTLRWDALAELRLADADASLIRDREIGIAPSPHADLDLAADFLDWLRPNLEAFKTDAAYQAFEYDLIWDDNLEEAELASKLVIQSVTVRCGFVEVWFDTRGRTTDHLLMAKLDRQFEIAGMEL